MAAGAASTIISMMALAWVKQIVQGILGIFGADPDSNGVKNTIIVMAVAFVYVLDFAINTGEVGQLSILPVSHADGSSQSKQASELSL
jgi:ABC-type Fe3+-siderophore transport system permease subunit